MPASGTPRISVVIVDDNPNVHDAVATLLRHADDIELVGQAHSGEAALKLCQVARPDLVLMDVVMPGMSGAETTRQLTQLYPTLRVLVLSSYSEYEYIKVMLDNGAVGYLVKDAIAEDLVDTIRNTVKGNTVLSPAVARIFLDLVAEEPQPDFGLTDRELQVLRLMAKGQTNAQIAVVLHISQPTVRFHFNNILSKLRVETRSEALVIAARNQLV